MRIKIPLYVISIVLALIGFPLIFVMLYLDFIDSEISSKFLWATSIVCCILSVLSFSLGHILAVWEEEDEEE